MLQGTNSVERGVAVRAVANHLLEAGAIDGARGILINVTGSSSVKLAEVNESLTIIQSAAHEDANIIFGAVHDEKMKDEVKITVIATGFKGIAQKTHAAVNTAAAIANTRTASAFVPAALQRPQPTNQAPAPAPTAVAAPARHEAQSLEAVKSSVKANYSQDDLDVPAFLRKKGEMQ